MCLSKGEDDYAIGLTNALGQATIPFRADPVTVLRDRLASLGIVNGELDEMLERAVRVGNRDVANFARLVSRHVETCGCGLWFS